MRRLIMSALALAALSSAAYAQADEEYYCMRGGPMNSTCQMMRQQRQQENEIRRMEAERRAQAQRCQFTRCY
jgi:hypothetical protein